MSISTPTHEEVRTERYYELALLALEQSGCKLNWQNMMEYFLNADFRRLVNSYVFDPRVIEAFGPDGSVSSLTEAQFIHHVDPVMAFAKQRLPARIMGIRLSSV